MVNKLIIMFLPIISDITYGPNSMSLKNKQYRKQNKNCSSILYTIQSRCTVSLLGNVFGQNEIRKEQFSYL